MLHIGGKLVLKLKRVMLRLRCVDWNIVTEFWRHCAPLKFANYLPVDMV